MVPQQQDRWVVDGHRVEKRWSFFGGRVVVHDAAGARVADVELVGGSEWPLEIAGRTYKLVRSARKNALDMRVERLELYADDETLLPRSTAAVVVARPAPDGARCAAHPEAAAAVSCARCGTFACPACAADGAHCRACLGAQVAVEQRERSALAWGGGALVLLYLFGAVGFVLGGVAAAGAIRYARRTPREKFSALVPLAFYVAAGLASLTAQQALLRLAAR